MEHWWDLPFDQRVQLERALRHIIWTIDHADSVKVQAFIDHTAALNTPITLVLAAVALDRAEQVLRPTTPETDFDEALRASSNYRP
jgi:endonuclease V-like protein UPF0215 family